MGDGNLRLGVVYRCSKWQDCSLRQQFGGKRCFFMGRYCDSLVLEMEPEGKEMEVVARPRQWGTSLGIVIPKRTVDRLGIQPGDELRLLIKRTRSHTSMPIRMDGND